jgi:hypothetical protein
MPIVSSRLMIARPDKRWNKDMKPSRFIPLGALGQPYGTRISGRVKGGHHED